MSDPVTLARRIQSEAADPGRSVSLEAAAGAGKTKVLVDRYLRLCLSGRDTNLDPRAILAITFTRKATVEIQARLQEQARLLAIQDAGPRQAMLAGLFGRRPLPAEVWRAAWFHEALLEDPAGLGIETLHSFCKRIVVRFAAEAGLDPRMTVLDEQAEQVYRAEALDRLELELARDPQAAAAQAELAGTALAARARVAAVFGRRIPLQRWLDRVCPPGEGAGEVLGRRLSPCLEALMADLQSALLADTPLAGMDHPEPASLASCLIGALQRLRDEGLPRIAEPDGGAGLTRGLCRQLAEWRGACETAIAHLEADPAAVPAVCEGIMKALVTGDGRLRAVQGSRQTRPSRQVAFISAAVPVLRVLQHADLLALLRDNRTVLRHGLRALDIYSQLKRRDRVVDFQDLEHMALRLMTDWRLGPQVHYRLDARLAHMLLDEFQDTNRNQWDILRPLLEEVLSGGETLRTALIVGDVKQSIYRFRGAEPAIFGQARDLVRRQVGDESAMQLPTNFRSLGAIVRAVGSIFQQEPLAGLLGEAAAGARQEIARPADEGTVVCVRPFERRGDQSGHQRAAFAVAALIQGLLRAGTPIRELDPRTQEEAVRSLKFADILVLARNKTRLAVYEAALRRAGIPFTPAGRGLLARCREVQDVLSLLRWLTYAADDAAGAVVLRSPICRLSEQRVQELLASRLGRPGRRRRSLREVLQASAGGSGFEAPGSAQTPADGSAAESCGSPGEPDEDLARLSARLLGWFGLAGRLCLHDLLRRIYREADILERFEIALGEQARFNLLRLLDLALAAEARGGSLRDFVDELDRAALLGGQEEGALPAEEGAGRVRIMTVHGAKGLQAPVVILADAATPLRRTTGDLLLAGPPSADPGPAAASSARPCEGPWVHGVRQEHYQGPALPQGGFLPGPLQKCRRQQLDGLLAEEAHILYVALTRARDRLYVLGGVNDRQSADQTEGSYLGWLARADAEAPGAGLDWRDPGEFLADAVPPAAPGAGATAVDDQRERGHRTHGRGADELGRRASAAAGRLVPWHPPVLAPRFKAEAPSRLEDDRTDSDHPALSRNHGDDRERPGPASTAVRSGRRKNPATQRGSRIHALLERACLLGELPEPAAGGERRAEWEEARDVWEDPSLAWIFSSDRGSTRRLSEVAILHRVAGQGIERRRFGIIDRLIIRCDRVDVVDYKTNRIEPGGLEAAVAHYRPQLLAYRDALAALYPDRAIRCWILWTAPAMAGRRLTEVSR